LSHPASPIFVLSIFELGSHKLFAWAGLKPRSSWSLPLEEIGLLGVGHWCPLKILNNF
jgi:hypothetical protein